MPRGVKSSGLLKLKEITYQMANIIIKKNHERTGRTGNSLLGEWSGRAKQQMSGVSKENKGEFAQEKRVQELAKAGFNHAAIAGMTNMGEGAVKTMIKNTGNIHLDGKV